MTPVLPRTLADIRRLHESVALECKLAAGRDGKGALPDDFWPTYSAFANIRANWHESKPTPRMMKAVTPALVGWASAHHGRCKSTLQSVFQTRCLFFHANRKHRPVHVTRNPFDGHTFRNPGALRIPVAQALQGGVSDCRNRTMQQMFLMIGLGERAGSGMSRILHGWKALGHELRLTERYEPHEHTVLEMRWLTEPVAMGSPTSSEESSPESSPTSSPKTEEKIFQRLKESPDTTTQALADLLGISKRAVLKQVGKLKAQGRLRRVGPTKGGHWEVQP